MSSIYRALGVRSQILPNYKTNEFNPVAIVADLSRSFAPEAVEGRQVWCGTLSNPGTDPGAIGFSSCDWEFHSRGTGGVIVEYLEVVDALNATSVSVKIIDTIWGGASGFGGAWTAEYGMEIGGLPVESTLNNWRDVNVPIGGAPLLSISGNRLWLPTDRLYVPAGDYVRIRVSASPAAALRTTIFMIIREVPEIPGAP